MKLPNSPLAKVYKTTQKLPKKVRQKVISKIFGKVVPFVGTAGVVYEEFTPNKVVVSIENKRGVRNHIGQVHAVAMSLLAETATGFVLTVNMPSDRVNLIKSAKTIYRKPSKGKITATATLTDEQRRYILDNEKGELLVPCIITDENKEPAEVEMLWAWIPKSELDARRKKSA